MTNWQPARLEEGGFKLTTNNRVVGYFNKEDYIQALQWVRDNPLLRWVGNDLILIVAYKNDLDDLLKQLKLNITEGRSIHYRVVSGLTNNGNPQKIEFRPELVFITIVNDDKGQIVNLEQKLNDIGNEDSVRWTAIKDPQNISEVTKAWCWIHPIILQVDHVFLVRFVNDVHLAWLIAKLPYTLNQRFKEFHVRREPISEENELFATTQFQPGIAIFILKPTAD